MKELRIVILGFEVPLGRTVPGSSLSTYASPQRTCAALKVGPALDFKEPWSGVVE
jgi:hypothetical protein